MGRSKHAKSRGGPPIGGDARSLRGARKSASRALVTQYRQARAAGDTERAGALLVEAWRCAQDDADMLRLAAVSLGEMGCSVQAIGLIEEALARHGATGELCDVVGKLAFDLNLPEVAEKAYRTALSTGAADADNYARLAGALRRQGKYDDAFALLQETIPLFPECASLWSALALTMSERDGVKSDNREFMEEALRLNPDDYVVLVNYGNRLKGSEAEELYRRAIKVDPKKPDAYAYLGICEIARGELRSGWKNYERRMDPARGLQHAVRYEVGARSWTGQPLAGRTLLVMAEQGVGDEVFFAAAIPRLLEEAGQLCIGCDPRLVEIYRRSFPAAIVGGFEDVVSEGVRRRSFPDIDEAVRAAGGRIDYATPIGSVPSIHWTDTAALPSFPDGYLRANPERVRAFGEQMGSGDGRLRVGVSWESGKLEGERRHNYPGLARIAALLQRDDVECFSLQYSLSPEAIAEVNAEHGLALRAFGGVDLKDDLEANLAIMANLDVVVGPSIATQMLAKAAGCEVWELCKGWPWTYFGHEDGTVPLFPRARGFAKGLWFWASLADALLQALDKRVGRALAAPSEGGAASARVEERRVSSLPEHWRAELRDDLFYLRALAPTELSTEQAIASLFESGFAMRVGLVIEPPCQNAAEHSVADALERFLPVLRTPGVAFCIACAKEDVEAARAFVSAHDVAARFIHDLDVDVALGPGSVLALASQVDVMIGARSALLTAVLASGRPTWMVAEDPLDGFFDDPGEPETYSSERTAAATNGLSKRPFDDRGVMKMVEPADGAVLFKPDGLCFISRDGAPDDAIARIAEKLAAAASEAAVA